MRILVNAMACRVAGGRTLALNFLRSYREGGFPHELVVYAPAGAGYEPLAGDRVRIEVAPPMVHRGLARPWVDHVWMRRVMARERPDLLFAMGSIAYPVRLPQVVLFHWPYAIYPEREVWDRMDRVDRLTRGVRRWLFGRRVRHATCFAPQTETARRRLERLWGVTRAVVVPNGVSLPVSPDPARPASRTPGRIPAASRVLLCLTRYYPHKNHDVLIEVARLIRRQALPWVVVTTVSPDDDRAAPAWLERVRREGLEGIIVNLETVPMEEVPALYAASSALLLPTLLESFSGTYTESMFYGRPIFTSDRDFARDVCGDVAYYFNPHDPYSILSSMQDAFDDKDEMAERVEAGRRRCEALPDWPELTRRYVALFERVAREP